MYAKAPLHHRHATDAPVRPGNNFPDLSRILGASAWARLPAAVRDRFPSNHSADKKVRYIGRMAHVEASWLGRKLAVLAGCFDTPVAPYVGEQILTQVNVYPDAERRGIVWERIYHFPTHDPVTVRSTKCLDADGNLLESLGGGLRMQLELAEHEGRLIFTSTGYYIALPGLSIRLPHWFPPGVTQVVHSDEGQGYFRFTMTTEHPWFGRMFFQEGIFRATEEANS